MKQDAESLWNEFAARQQLTTIQTDYFKMYYEHLIETNKLHNLTTITDLSQVITDHFEDSLALRKFIDCSTLQGLGDIGTGAGFPGIPLKIIYPDLPLVLIEVQAKKRAFLKGLSARFQFSNVIIDERDWRTFLRQSDYPLELFCARASLQPEELIRAFMPTSPYKKGKVVYWASQSWTPSVKVAPFVGDTYAYRVGSKERSLVLLSLNEHKT